MDQDTNPYQESAPKRESGTGLRLLITIGGLFITVVGAIALGINLLSNYSPADKPAQTKPAASARPPVTGPDEPGGMVGQGDLPDPPKLNEPASGTPEIRDGNLAGKYMNVTRIRTSYDYSWYVGLYKNTGSAMLRKPRLELQFLDDNGRVIETPRKMYSYGARGRLAPGESTPFRIRAAKVPPHKSWRILHKPQEPFVKRPRLKLKISNVKIGLKTRFGAYSVTGNVLNQGDKTASLVKLIALAYDAENRITGHTTHYLQTKKLAPGAKAEFSFRLHHVNEPPKKVFMDYTGWIDRGSSNSTSTTKSSGTKKSEKGGGAAWPE